VRLVRGLERTERIEEALALARSDHAPLDAELVDRTGEAEALHDHADRADEARLVNVDLVGTRRDVIAAGCRHVLDDGDRGLVGMLGAQPPQFVVDLPACTGLPPGL